MVRGIARRKAPQTASLEKIQNPSPNHRNYCIESFWIRSDPSLLDFPSGFNHKWGNVESLIKALKALYKLQNTELILTYPVKNK